MKSILQKNFSFLLWAVMWVFLSAGVTQAQVVVVNELAKLVASDGASFDVFGGSVAVSGDTAVVGAFQDGDLGTNSGSAYVFVRTGATWTQQAKLLASDGAAFDQFGGAVAISGDTVVVGARADDNFRGSAYLFVRSGTTWTQQAKLVASDGAAFDQFGGAFAISGDTAVVGAFGDDDSGLSSGSAYVFVRTGTTWTPQAKLTASDAAAGDNFGFSVSLSGDTAVVGANFDDDPVIGSNTGSAYVFVRAGTTWTQQAKLTAFDSAADDAFGNSVAISGDTAVVGANGDDDSGLSSGSAYVFVRTGTTWTPQAKLLASDGATSDLFARSVAVSGNTVVAGATEDSDNGTASGSAYVFVRAGTIWTQQAKLRASDAASKDRFGTSVAVSGDTAVVGAFGDDSSRGSAYVFEFASDSDGPITSNVLANPNPASVSQSNTLTAHIDDSTTGGSTVASADFEIRDGAAVVLSGTGTGACSNSQLPCPDDTQFDEVDEDVAVTIDPGDLTPGVYNSCVRGTDASANAGAFTCSLLVVYDPSDGFVTGGGWINSLAGASTAFPLAVGKATFGFVSKYQRGATIPTGQTQFQFQAGNLNFHSSSYDWLVVSGPMAQYKGSGTINGSGDYGFLLRATDGAVNGSGPDKFRIMIWIKETGAPVYDNGADQVIEGGGIVIHTK